MDSNDPQVPPPYTAVPPVPPPGYVAAPPQYPPAGSPPPVAMGGLSEYSAAALSYLTFIPAVIFLVLEPYNKSAFVRFHAIQCIAFTVVSVGAHIVLLFVPFVGWILSPILSLAFFILWVMCLMKASKGEWYKLPVIGDFAMQQAKAL